ncbi:Uncharacterized protein APZ42_029366 [Daphnia magna]|uniref:Uncharacterized protein n=1 Tax=Daphnia magna TaxID=35525 RepID=A0A164PHD5_9CRUS|nr:Uncharacterized protein APZ42_029366 [Daphnia magna]
MVSSQKKRGQTCLYDQKVGVCPDKMEQRRRPFSIAEIKEKTPIQGASLMVQPIEGEFNQS